VKNCFALLALGEPQIKLGLSTFSVAEFDLKDSRGGRYDGALESATRHNEGKQVFVQKNDFFVFEQRYQN
jgi:hypothetical protein